MENINIAIPQTWDESADVVIVGSGLSGLAAAIVANELGLSVILIEKMSVPGGNSVIAGGGINAVDPVRQERQGIVDSRKLYYNQTMACGDYINTPEKVKMMVDNALEDGVHFLERLGVVWSKGVTRGFGSLFERTHVPDYYIDKNNKKKKMGAANIYAMLDRLVELNQKILYRHKMTQIFRERPLFGRILGIAVDVNGRKKSIMAKRGVILASGGFAANLEWVTLLDPRLAKTGTTNHKGATGECIKMAQDIGADTLHMDYIQAIPWGKARPPLKGMFYFIESEEIRKKTESWSYRIFVNCEGNRFVDEGARRDTIKHAVMSQTQFEPKINVVADSIEDLEKQLGMPKNSLKKTVENYNIACDTGHDKAFGKDPNILVPLKTSPFKATCKTMKRHHTMGGLRVKGESGQVIDRWGNVISGLYAAGEITGGTHGTNRMGHNSTGDCLIFGQLCAKKVAEEKPWSD